ncbi:MAG: response regulator [Candidatus Sulfotelmatobacter sp.]|jgi:CheY-like chemotaxis protein
MSGLTILCVEDRSDYMAILTAMLEGIGYDVIPARSKGQAIELLSKQPFDGILLEYNLADAPGTSLRAEMKRMRPHVPVLLFDGASSQTPVMLRFFDAYLHDMEKVGAELGD